MTFKTLDSNILKYKISLDKQGLIAYLGDGNNYHIHSDELTALEKWILELLKKENKK